MITFCLANKGDSDKIADFHARSWQENYKNTFSEDYLKNRVIDDRLNVWRKRFENPNPNQHVILAEENSRLIGFACTYLNDDPHWGALLDNLHVAVNMKGRGLGRELMHRSATWVFENIPTSHYYLWVLEENKAAMHFYERLGGTQNELISEEMPDGNMAKVFRYVWTDLQLLMK